ncbi:MAG: FAD-dependent oxidoreductase [Pseudomonadota bacterium]
MQIAVVGAGLTGCLAALELGDRGHGVTLFEAGEAALTRASFANEGKIHLGYVYAADASFDTARRLIDDAVRFRPILERWIPSATIDALMTEGFSYYVLPDSMLSVEQIAAHFGKVDAHMAALEAEHGARYLGLAHSPVQPVDPQEGAPHTAGYLTQERALWPEGVARALREALERHPRITLRTRALVARIEPAGPLWRVALDGALATPEGPFDGVINAAWADRRRIDAASGFAHAGEWITRFKFGVVLHEASQVFPQLPQNSTAVLGAYGDSVYYPGVDLHYSCWYPVGMCFRTTGPIDAQSRPPLGSTAELAEQTWRGMASQDPAFAAMAGRADPEALTVIGDYIIAKGRSDILDPESRLHQRQDHGPIRLAKGYWSIETGKYSSAAPCAIDCVDALLGER